MATNLPPPPIKDESISFFMRDWLTLLHKYVGGQNGLIPWDNIDTSGSNITDLATRLHNTLQGLQGGTSGQYYHLSQAEYDRIIDITNTITTSTYNKNFAASHG